MNLPEEQFDTFWRRIDMWEKEFYEEYLENAVISGRFSENPAESQADGYVDPGCWRCGKLESDHSYMDGISYCDEMDKDEYGNYWGDPMRTYAPAPFREEDL